MGGVIGLGVAVHAFFKYKGWLPFSLEKGGELAGARELAPLSPLPPSALANGTRESRDSREDETEALNGACSPRGLCSPREPGSVRGGSVGAPSAVYSRPSGGSGSGGGPGIGAQAAAIVRSISSGGGKKKSGYQQVGVCEPPAD